MELAAFLRYGVIVMAIWAIASVILSVPVAAVFRLEARRARLYRQSERRRAWRDLTD